MDILVSLGDRLALFAKPQGLSGALNSSPSDRFSAAMEATSEADTIIADLEGSVINGGGGNDRLLGRRGDDRLIGGQGDDFLRGAGGDDTLIGSAGADTLIGGGGSDSLKGGGGADSLKGGGGFDTLIGGGGEDTLVGGGGSDTLKGGGGADELRGGGGADSLIGGGGSDRLIGGNGVDTMIGSRGEDFLAGDGGADLLIGGGGGDVMFGGNGDDDMRGDADSDFLNGEDGADTLSGGAGEDFLDGGAGDDVLFGGANFDQLFGGEGDDTLAGGQDNSTLTGGAGADRFVYARDGGIDTITDFNPSEGDRIDLSERGIRRASEFDVIAVDETDEQPGGALISFRGAGEIFLEGASAESISADAFVFEDFEPAQSVVSGAGQGAVAVGDGPLTLRLEVEDPDPDERFFIPAVQEGIFGDFEITAEGAWTFTIDEEDPETLALAEGIVGIDTFDVSTLDAEIFTISVAVTGKNDAPRLLNDPGDGAPFFPNFITDQFGSFEYSAFFVDPDNGDQVTYEISFQPPGTTFFPSGDSIGVLEGTIPTDGLFLTPPPGLSNVPFKVFLTTITVTDEAGASVSVNHELRVTLRQFPAEIGGDLEPELIEGVDEIREGSLTISDRNDTEDRFRPIAEDPDAFPFVLFSLTERGDYRLRFKDDLSEDAAATIRGATEKEVIAKFPQEVLSVDGTSKIMQLIIEGGNDTPELVEFVPDQMLTTDDTEDPTATLILDPDQFFFDVDFSHAENLDFTLDGSTFSGQREFEVGTHLLTLRATDPLGEFAEDVFTLTVIQGTDDPS